MLLGMKAPKILAVASAVDLDFRYGCTPAWWQLWKGLYEVGVDLIVTPYRGKPVESPWWRTAREPDPGRGRELRGRSRRARAAQGRPVSPPRGGEPGRLRARQGRARDDLALGHASLAPAPDEGARAGEGRRRGDRLHRADGALPRDPHLPAGAVRRPGDLLRRRRADEPAGVRRHGHRLQLLPRRRPVRIRHGRLELRGRAAEPARAGRATRRGRLLGRRPRVLRTTSGREAARRLLLRLRRQVPPRLDGGDGGRAEPRRAGARVRARRPRLPGRHRARLARRRRSVQRLRAGDLRLADQPEHHPPLARERDRLVVVPAVRARGSRRRDRLEPLRGDRALVRAGAGAARRQRRGRGARRLPRAARPTRLRPRRWAPVPASASSTSTRTRIAPGSCSRWSDSVPRRACVPERRRLAIVPARNEEGAVEPRRRGAARLRP